MKSFLISTIISLTFLMPQSDKIRTSESHVLAETDSIKNQAFEILKTKCNVCHEKKNKDRVFTIDNMDKNSKKIYRQVFKWKRMPKGNDIKLTSQEYKQLKNWISSLNQK